MGMIKVIEIDKIIDVPDDYIECSVCGKWKPFEDYKKPGEVNRSRTNCYSCYDIPFDEMKELAEKYKRWKHSTTYVTLRQELGKMREYMANSIPIEEMIANLQKLPPGSRVVITQNGYYAEGECGYIMEPEEKIEISGVKYFSIGHSNQEC